MRGKAMIAVRAACAAGHRRPTITATAMAATSGAARPGLFSTRQVCNRDAIRRGGPPSLPESELMII